MNGSPLSAEELYALDQIMYLGKRRRTERHEDSLRVYVPEEMILPPSSLEDVHDFTHIKHCLKSGRYPSHGSMLGLLNREEVERISSEVSH
jgi:hypothetical protein